MKAPSTLVLLAAMGLAACQQNASTATAADAAADPAAATIATVDGKAISKGLFDFYVQAAAGKATSELSDEQRKEVLDSLTRAFVVSEQAVKDGLEKDPEIASQLELVRLEILQRAVQSRYLKDKTPTEAELRAEYETQLAQMSRNEYRASHILVQTEAFANELLGKLKAGAKFNDLAKANSLDASKERGGDLGWFAPQSMVKPFSDAVMTLKKGEVTMAPVQTQYGFHIIRLDDTRETEAPPFDQVKQQLNQVVLGKKFRAYADELLKTSKIENKL